MNNMNFRVAIKAVDEGCAVDPQADFPIISGQLTIGRSRDADIHLDDVSISRRHLHIQTVSGHCRKKVAGSQTSHGRGLDGLLVVSTKAVEQFLGAPTVG